VPDWRIVTFDVPGPSLATRLESRKVAGMKVTPAGSVPTKQGPADYFTGTVWQDEISPGAAGSRVRALKVSFEPGARTAWHAHPYGQTLHILAGIGRVQRAGGPVQEVRPGDTIWFDPGERHWHGAAPGQLMIHLAIQQADEKGNAATWFEKVTDAEYNSFS
jgi:quercetin dioxygenase-like cupin family protein